MWTAVEGSLSFLVPEREGEDFVSSLDPLVEQGILADVENPKEVDMTEVRGPRVDAVLEELSHISCS